MPVVYPVITNRVILIAAIQYILWFNVLVFIVAFIKRDRMAEAPHAVWRKQGHRIIEILELTEGYINNYNSLRETSNLQYHKQSFGIVFQDPSFDEKSYLYTSIRSAYPITEDNKESILVKSSTR